MTNEEPGLWKATLACTAEQAERIIRGGDALDPWDSGGFDGEDTTSIVTRETERGWLVEVYSEGRPAPGLLTALARLIGLADPSAIRTHRLAAADWVKMSQESLQPVRAGRFHVHTARTAGGVRPNEIGLRIEGGQAFGTGQHATTAGCLQALDRLARHGPAGLGRLPRALDLGTGSAILAIAIARRWPGARTIATDIDPLAISVARENLRVNGVRPGRGAGMVALAVADGTRHPLVAAGGPYDLIVANVLAQPLVDMAGDIVRVLARGGTLILAGLLRSQAAKVGAAYRVRGCIPLWPPSRSDWPALVFRRPGKDALLRPRPASSRSSARRSG